ncbi:class I SAM-dependent methyltransferase [Streptomyces sp. NPDC059092]|uniref:class I SAM-dependent methyltransferase n=1 Tax=Streptomyces sp. NPDC059092 TaxID=3346725 RepID=UPI0036B6B467
MLRDTFDEDAELYDRARPAYPAPLVEELAARARLGPGRRVLEVGPGTGQLTVPLARYGCRITAVEVGASLAAVASRNLRPFPDTEVVVAPFETWAPPPEPYDLMVVATAFHWLDPAVRLARAADALRAGGLLALVTTHHVASETTRSDDAFFADAQQCYERWDPATPPGLRLRRSALVTTDTGELAGSDLFGPVSVARWTREITYSADAYVDVLLTYSGHRALEPGAREGLLSELRALIDGRYGGRVTKTYLHELIAARKRPGDQSPVQPRDQPEDPGKFTVSTG